MAENTLPSSITDKLLAAVNPERLLKTATALVEVPSPTRSAGAAADRLAAILREDGFRVERPEADWAESPAVVTRLDSGSPAAPCSSTGTWIRSTCPLRLPASSRECCTAPGPRI